MRKFTSWMLPLLTIPMASAALAGPDAITVGVINDLSGVYADLGGQGSVVAAQIAVDEFGPKVLGKPIKIMSGDHQNKPDIGSQLARRWFDVDNVDMVIDFPNSGVALAVQEVAREKKKVAIFSTAGSTDLTGKACSPTGFQWTYDNYSNSAGLAQAMVKNGFDSWYFLTVDYAFGISLENEASKALTAAGGKMVGSARHPLNTADFSSFLLTAQASKAKVIALASAGGDVINAVKQAGEFGIGQGGQTLVAPVTFITDVHALGLSVAQGLTFITGYYWDLNDDTRAFAKKFYERRKAMPTMAQAGVYSGVLHYLKAIAAAGTDNADAVAAKMRELPVHDAFTQAGTVRADGRMVHDMYLVQVKKPSESKAPWDYYKVLATVPADVAFRPLADSTCPLVKK
ncbi:ABC transporter substrate-binding protein [Bradyrhizobium sp. KBS0727]|uniref:ABC transporter substrate-binding protein n=1 Tax=unclassified Bradyrhizobium TaxID=2631580 RepID=UPI00110E3059|nr:MULTISPECIES: ABC transporter substrate-binding protein [unclassified Bradyrhizobium]QDW38008.1 ABC transporter substrate-binding protein [Bradyrhizobium sp. KBS0725]QDW44612.1 ABC transporter substrate-binding protein [Bradyrhizobium sp. KBS0727]